MSSPSTAAPSVEDVEKKTPGQTLATEANSVSEGHAASTSAEYDRYLDLHRRFEGAAQKKLLRKRMLHAPLNIPVSITNMSKI